MIIHEIDHLRGVIGGIGHDGAFSDLPEKEGTFSKAPKNLPLLAKANLQFANRKSKLPPIGIKTSSQCSQMILSAVIFGPWAIRGLLARS